MVDLHNAATCIWCGGTPPPDLPPLPPVPVSCTWVKGEGDAWHTQCGNTLALEGSGASALNYCGFCGGRLIRGTGTVAGTSRLQDEDDSEPELVDPRPKDGPEGGPL